MKTAILVLVCCAGEAFSQSNTAVLSGMITDPAGAAVPLAAVTATNNETRLSAKTTTNEQGAFALPSMPPGRYNISVAKPGFKITIKAGIEIAAGVNASVNVRLELGEPTESVTVVAGAEIVQTTSAALSSTIVGLQIHDLPLRTRNGMELFTLLPGAQTTVTGLRQTFLNGMPMGLTNITVDGINTNDNWQKSGDGFYSVITPSLDSLEEATITMSAAAADSTAQGGAQLKFVTRSGTNRYHGGAFWQHRNTFFNANSYFNTINRLPRDVIKLNQGGLHLGGPVRRNKLLFFVNYELYRLPNSGTFSRNVLPPAGQAGNFSYCPATTSAAACVANPGLLRTVNLLAMAGQANASLPAGVRAYKTSVDPIIGATLSRIWGLVQGGNLQTRQPANDFNRDTYLYTQRSTASRASLTARVDYNLTENHHFSFVFHYDSWIAAPDVGTIAVPMYEGTGTVLGSTAVAGQRSLPFAGTLTLRSALSARMTNELRVGASGGTFLSSDAIAPAAFSPWRGYNPMLGYVAGVVANSGSSRSNAPVKDLAETLSWVRGRHQFSFGGDWQSIGMWSKFASVSTIPNLFFGMAQNDPAIAGNTAWLTAANLTGISANDLASAGAMYAMLTGRVAQIGQAVVLDENTHQYAHAPSVDRNRQREVGLFAQDTWRIRANLTLNYGLRLEHQFPFVSLSETYSYPGVDGLWGVSGVGHLFQPGTLTGVAPALKPITGHTAYDIRPQLLPSLGLAYQLPASRGIWSIFTGKRAGAAVLRAGYAIASTRGGGNNFTYMWAANRGPTFNTAVSPLSAPEYFGPAGSVYFSDAVLPERPYSAKPQYPITPAFTDELDEFDPHLKLGYLQSWNIGYQRELSRNTVVEVRYTGNHGVRLWRQIDVNEINIFENGFLDAAKVARQNLAIANGVTPDQLLFLPVLKSSNFGDQGLTGQQAPRLFQSALGNQCCADTNTAINLARLQLGAAALSIQQNATQLANLTGAGYPVNFFQANPAVLGGAYLMTNLGSSYYHAGQIDLRRRLSTGLQLQGSYVWAHSLINGPFANSASYNLPTTLRNLRLDRVPPPYDIRHALKANWIYELPVGRGRRFLPSARGLFLRKAAEGWELAGTSRIQAGQPGKLLSNRQCINGNECGVVLHNITPARLQSLMGVYKTTGSNGIGALYDLPPDLIRNSEAAFLQGGTLDPNAPYIGPQTVPGQLGYNYYLRGPWQKNLDVSVIKRTSIREHAVIEARAQALNVLNVTNFSLGSTSVNSTTFGQITAAYRDLANAQDPGGRILEFVLRISF